MAESEARTCPCCKRMIWNERDDTCGRMRCNTYAQGLRAGIAQAFRDDQQRRRHGSVAAEQATQSAEVIVAFARIAVQGFAEEAVPRREALFAADMLDSLAQDSFRASDTTGMDALPDGNQLAGKVYRALADLWRHEDSWKVGS